jgi:hypothetical protein
VDLMASETGRSGCGLRNDSCPNEAAKEVFGTAFNLYIISQGVAMRLSLTNMFDMLRPGSAWGFDHLLLKSPPQTQS